MAQLVQGTLQLSRRGERAREVPPHRERVRERASAVVDRECLAERGPRRRVVAPAELDLAQPVQGGRRVGPLLARPPGREGVAIQPHGEREVAVHARQPREIDEIRRGNLVAAVMAVQRERGFELPACLIQVARRLRQEAEVIVVRRGAARVPDPLPQRERSDVSCLRRGEVPPILTYARERPDGVRLDPNVSYARGQQPRPVEIRHGAVHPAFGEQAGPDVAEQPRDARRVVDRRDARQGAPPDPDGRGRAVTAIRRDARPPRAVGPHLRRPALRRPGGEPLHLTHQERVAPRHGVRGRDPPGRAELPPGERVGYRVPHGERSRPRLEHER